MAKKAVPNCRTLALARARKYLGVKEHPPNSNRGPDIDRWQKWSNGFVGYPWCAAFACGMFREVGHRLTYPRQASVGFLAQWAKENGMLLGDNADPRPGDLVCYNFDSDNWPDHIGFLERVLAVRRKNGKFVGFMKTVEGNTSFGNDANGGAVMVRYRWASRCLFIRVNCKKLEEL